MLDSNSPTDRLTSRHAGKKSHSWPRVVVASSVLLIGGFALGIWLWPDAKDTDEHSSRNDAGPTDSWPVVVNPGYVGIRACTECHAERVAEFKRTRHYLACTTAAGIRAPGFTSEPGNHASRDPTAHFEMKRVGDEFIATGVQNTPQGERRNRYAIGLVYGAGGGGDEMYFSWQGDRLYNLPIGWLYPLNRWGNAVESIDAREVPESCIECHNTWAEHIPGVANEYRRDSMILGVTCERCHGPAKEHIAHHQLTPNDAAHAIVHPGKLSRARRLIEVCTQRHGNIKPREPAFSYRPGEELDKFYRTVHNKHREDEQVANQIEYLRQSKCFQKSEMTCIDCHNPHRPQQPAAVRGACLNCHTSAACGEQPRLPAAVRNDCADATCRPEYG